MNPEEPVREIRINPVVPSESVLVATERSLRPRKEEERVPHDTRAHVYSCPFCKGKTIVENSCDSIKPAARILAGAGAAESDIILTLASRSVMSAGDSDGEREGE